MALTGALLLAATGLSAGATAVRGTGESSPPTGSVSSVDLDGDGSPEEVLLGSGRGGISIRDGDMRYTSRPLWWVASAAIADIDRNGLPEVVALLDAADGRHLGLIGWHAGGYRERLVSAALARRPPAFETRDDPTLGGWVVVLTEPTTDSDRRLDPDGPCRTTTYRWNGFGFIAIAGEGVAHHDYGH